MALLAMAIHNLGYEARSFTGSQAGVITTSAHGRARIIDVTPGRLRGALDEGAIAIVAGFQGVSQDTKDITTLGRGGSDTTAVALAAALRRRRLRDLHRRRRRLHRRPADRAERPAHRADHLRGDAGAGRLRREGAACCAASSTPAGSACRSTSARRTRTTPARWSPARWRTFPWSKHSSPASRTTAAKPRSRSSACRTSPGAAARIFETVAGAEINIDMIVQNVSTEGTGRTDISFTLPQGRRPDRDGRARQDPGDDRASRACSTTTTSARCR